MIMIPIPRAATTMTGITTKVSCSPWDFYILTDTQILQISTQQLMELKTIIFIPIWMEETVHLLDRVWAILMDQDGLIGGDCIGSHKLHPQV